MMPLGDHKGSYEQKDCSGRICIFECDNFTDAHHVFLDKDEMMDALALDICRRANDCQAGGGVMCICVLPESVEPFEIPVKVASLAKLNKEFPLAVMSYAHGQVTSIRVREEMKWQR